MASRSYRKLKNGLKKFLVKEPVYMWLLIFILVINVLTLIPNPDKAPEDQASGKKEPPAVNVLDNKAELEKAVMRDSKVATVISLVVSAVAISVFLGIVLDFAILLVSSGGKTIFKRSHAPPKIRWSIWDALKVIILFFFFGYCIAIMGALILPIFPKGADTGAIVSIISTTIMDIMGIVIIFYFAFFCYRHKARDLGLTLKNFFRNVLYGFVGYLSALPVLFVTLIVTALIVELARYKPAPQPVFNLFMGEKSAPVLAYLAIFVAVAGPIMEEIFFRGFVYTAFKKEIGVNGAVVASAFLFSLLHVHLIGFLPILILGIFLAYLYEKTGSLVSSITVHVLHNLVMVGFIFLLKGLT